MWLEIKQLTRLQIIRYCEKLEKENKSLKDKISEVTMVADDEKQTIEHVLELEKENKTNSWLVKYWKAQYEEQKKEIKNRDELIRYYKKKVKDLKTEIGKLVKWE